MYKKTNVAGVQFGQRQGYLNYLYKNQNNAFVYLQAEPTNEHDANAIKVMAHIRGGRTLHVGYLPKELAQTTKPIMDRKKVWVTSFKHTYYRDDNNKVQASLTIEFTY